MVEGRSPYGPIKSGAQVVIRFLINWARPIMVTNSKATQVERVLNKV